MLLRELFEPPANIKFTWQERVHPNQRLYQDTIRLGQDDILIQFYFRGHGVYLVEFSVNDEYGITGEGNAAKIFGVVLAGIRDFIETHKPQYLVFDAEQHSREKLYIRLIKRLSTSAGYRTITKRSLPNEYLRDYGAVDLYHTPFMLKRVSKI